MTQMIIADTSGLYAVVDAKDPNHRNAAAFLKSLAPGGSFGQGGGKLILSNHIFDELMTLTKARLSAAVALQLGLRLRNSQFVELVTFSEAQEQTLWRMFHRYHNKAWSYVPHHRVSSLRAIFIILGERLTRYEWLGAVILLGSMMLLYRQREGTTA